MRGFASFIAGAALGLVFAASLAGILSIRTPLAERGPDDAPAGAPEPQRDSEAGESGADTQSSDARRDADETVQTTATPEQADDPSPNEPAPEQPASEETGAGEAPAEDGATNTETPAAPDQDAAEASPPDPNAAAPASPIAPAAPGPVASEPPGDAAAQARTAPVAFPSPPEIAGRPAAGSSLAPFEANAAAFSRDRSAPLLAIALIDVGERGDAGADIEAGGPPPGLMRLSGPLAIVLDPSADAQALAPDLREAGFETLIRLDADALRGAGVGDTGVREMIDALAGEAGEVIGAAALGAPLIDDTLAGEVVDALTAAGFGLLDATGADGGSTLFARAAEGDLPAAATGRRIDAVATSAYVYQSLERAAYEARGAGAFVAVGDLSPTVLKGVRRWLALKADGAVTLAPLSVVMTKIAER